jgi:nitrite reductase (NO-forming)/hydroxylamine reductase
MFSVTLRDTGEVALIDGDTKEIRSIVKTGYAVHISRLSASGRYVYVIGRDGRLSLIDLWMEKPAVVAEVKIGFDARSVDTSKFKGYEDKYADRRFLLAAPVRDHGRRHAEAAQGRFHPRHDGGWRIPPRAARGLHRLASFIKPEWVVNIKETGQILLVDYSDIKNLKTTTIESAKFLHDGGWDASKRYFLVAANASNKIAAVDTKTGKLAALVDTAKIPHPGRGANFVHPKFGPVWATGHLGADVVTLISTPSDKKKHAKYKEYNWKVVQEMKHAAGQPVRQDPSEVQALLGRRAAEPGQGSGRIRRRLGHGRSVQAEGCSTWPRIPACRRPRRPSAPCIRSTARRQGSLDLPVGRQDRPVRHRGL